MGKKSGRGGEKKEKAKAFVLKVDMHCDCKGCNDKIRAAVKDITLLQGIESWDQSALGSKGELRLVATADPEKLQHRLHKATRKNVALLFPKDKDKEHNNKAAAAAVQAQTQQTAWANHLLAGTGTGWNAHGGGYHQPAAGYATQSAYPSWTVQQPADPYAAYSAYPAAASGGWGAAYYPPPTHGHGAYGWHGHGY